MAEDERQLLESSPRESTSPYCEVVRAEIILLAAQAFPSEVIGSRLDTPRQIVRKWHMRFCLSPLAGPRGEADGSPAFRPSLVVRVKALACKPPHRTGLPRSCFSIAFLNQRTVAQISGTTIWRWVNQDARPWR